jgi:hypothetical protein
VRFLLPVCLGVPERCFYQDFLNGICEALQELGHATELLPFKKWGEVTSDETSDLRRRLKQTRPDAVLDLCCWGASLSHVSATPSESEGGLFDAYQVRYVAALFDQPFFQALRVIRTGHLQVVYPDLGHPSLMRWAFPDLRPAVETIAPPAVRVTGEQPQRDGESHRTIEVLYVGNLDLRLTERFWAEPWADFAGFDPAFCDQVAEILLSEPEAPLHRAVETVVAARPLASDFPMRAHLSYLELFRRHRYRRDAVVGLARAGIRMVVVGRQWDQLSLPVNVRVLPTTDYEGMFRLAASSKICLDVSTYVDGVNDRVFSYALNRAVCFTNASGYLRNAESAGIRFYSMRNITALVEEIGTMLARPRQAAEVGELARQTVLRAHTWRQRVQHILADTFPKLVDRVADTRRW